MYYPFWASLLALTVKNLPEMQETQIQSLDQEDPLEKGMATYSNTLTWRSPWIEEPGELQSMVPKESYMTERLTLHFNYFLRHILKL